MMDRTDSLIQRLAETLTPVKRLRPPLVRAALWLIPVAILAAVLIFGFANMDIFVRRVSDQRLALELIGTLFTGIFAIMASFELSLPDRSDRWALLPLPPLALWLGSSGYSCWRHWITHEPDGWTFGESAHCFVWIVGFGVPLALALMLALRQAKPISPVLPTVVGGLGVAALAAFLLQFFHPIEVSFMDLGLHVAAVAVVVALARVSMRRIVQ